MICRYRTPGGVLGNFVELFWLYDPYVVPHAQERLLPTATTELVFDLRDGLRGLEDSQGNQWWLATHIEDVSPEEIQRRAPKGK